ncbi:MAG: LysR family transcriptional regulator ArgP [Pseudomonadota bacterium]
MKLDPAQLDALSTILRLGSFDAAAVTLNVTPSAISQRIKSLEEQIGATLVIRGMPCEGTALGKRLAKHAEDVALMEAAVLGARGKANAPHIRLAVPADSLATWLVPALAKTPKLLFDLQIDDQDTADELLRQGTVSAAVTGHARAAPGCDVFALGALRYIATASPAYMRSHFASGVNARTLAAAPMLTFTPKDHLQNRWVSQKTGEALHPPRHQMPSTHAFIDATLHGLAWGMNPEALIADHLAAHRLVALDPDLPLDVPLYWQITRAMAPALELLTRAIKQTAQTYLRRLP